MRMRAQNETRSKLYKVSVSDFDLSHQHYQIQQCLGPIYDSMQLYMIQYQLLVFVYH